MKKLLTTCFATLYLCAAYAQVLTPDWESSLSGKVKWIQVNDWGIVIAACDNGLFGLDPRDGTKIWELSDVTKIQEEYYNTIPGTPLVLIDDKGADAKTLIINGLSGALVFDSRDEGIEKVLSRRLVREVGGIMITYSKASGDGVALYNFNDGKELWNTPMEKAKGRTLAQPVIDSEGHILYANGSRLFRLHGQTGAVLWEAEAKKDYIDLFFSPDEATVFAVSGSPSDLFKAENAEPSALTVSGGVGKFSVQAHQVATGEPIWKKPIQYSKSKYSGVALGESDYLLLHTLSANRYSYDSPDPLWKKEKIGTGGDQLVGVYPTSDGMIYVGDDGSGRNYFNYVDEAGKPLWKKRPVVTGYISHIEDQGDAIFYITSKGANFLSKENGKELWTGSKYLSSDFPVSFVKDSDQSFVLLAEGKLIRVDLPQKDWSVIGSSFDFKGEVPSGVRLVGEKYAVTGNQNVTLLDASGNKVYHQYYEAPDQSLGAKLALGTLSAAAEVGAMVSGMSAFAYGFTGAVQGNDSYMNKAEQQAMISNFATGAAGDFSQLAKMRFGAQAASEDYKLILTERDKLLGFVKIDLASGEEQGMVVTADRTPTFTVDAVTNKLYLKSAEGRLACYDL
ncbi:outer membrane protein assembly factor BamB family protein [Marinoscillum furvescens]|uniref:Putative pyrroloquinoline-quinone binding quinoprotein n=1 Tax=Marinoscillum furvescens DSM 4134 TaxID=1122208 RepID=A0A3D9L6E5_MARFU|nr:PQQ-binding-like beta-propeller repeat protein [Marinoscillum furvescens]REE00538.1 putative pyrroloquinoline-quinone binding quinoprotein [Marinoscillum furvescens DSM 4134]